MRDTDQKKKRISLRFHVPLFLPAEKETVTEKPLAIKPELILFSLPPATSWMVKGASVEA